MEDLVFSAHCRKITMENFFFDHTDQELIKKRLKQRTNSYKLHIYILEGPLRTHQLKVFSRQQYLVIPILYWFKKTNFLSPGK